MDQTERRILELEVEVAWLRSLVVILSVYALPNNVLDAAIEDLEIPAHPVGNEEARVSDRVLDRLANKLAKGLA